MLWPTPISVRHCAQPVTVRRARHCAAGATWLIRLLCAGSLAGLVTSASADTLKPFSSDGCSAFPDGTLEHRELWLACCQQHDLAYWKGGTSRERVRADEALRQCVAQVGEPAIAALMLAGVRVGGSPYWPTRFRWGYGWRWPRFYKRLSDSERAQVERLTPRRPKLR